MAAVPTLASNLNKQHNWRQLLIVSFHLHCRTKSSYKKDMPYVQYKHIVGYNDQNLPPPRLQEIFQLLKSKFFGPAFGARPFLQFPYSSPSLTFPLKYCGAHLSVVMSSQLVPAPRKQLDAARRRLVSKYPFQTPIGTEFACISLSLHIQ